MLKGLKEKTKEMQSSILILVKNCCSVAKSCPTFYDPVNCSMPGFPVLHYFPEFAQTRVHWISDAIQPSHPLLHAFSLAISLSQHHGLFQWVSSLHQVAKVLSFSFSISPSSEYLRTDFLEDGLVGSPCSPRDSQESSPTPQFKTSSKLWSPQPQFKSISSSALSLLCCPVLTSVHDCCYAKFQLQLVCNVGAPKAALMSL